MQSLTPNALVVLEKHIRMNPSEYFNDKDLANLKDSCSFAYFYVYQRINNVYDLVISLRTLSSNLHHNREEILNIIKNDLPTELELVVKIGDLLSEKDSSRLAKKLQLVQQQMKLYKKSYVGCGGSFASRSSINSCILPLKKLLIEMESVISFLKKITVVQPNHLN